MQSISKCSRCILALAFCSFLSFFAVSGAHAYPVELDSIELTVNDAVIMAIENNKSVQIQRLNPRIQETKEEQQKSVFDTTLSAGLSSSSNKGSSGLKKRQIKESVDVSKRLKSGAEITIGLSTDNNSSGSDDALYSSRFGITFSKPLFEESGSDVNLANLKQAEIDTLNSNYELQGYAESLIEQVVNTYWDYALAQRKLEIYEDSLELAKQQLHEIEVMVEVGKLAEIELVAARAEVASREQSLINVRSQCETLRLKLLRLINPGDSSDYWGKGIAVIDQFVMPEIELGNVESHVDTAMEMRPDLSQARLLLERGDLEIVKTQNGLLPRLDIFITLGQTGYAETFGNSYGDIFSDGYDMQFGLNYQYNIGQRNDKAKFEQSLFKKEQSAIAIENMKLMVQEDVRIDWIEIERSRKQIEASKATIRLQEEKLRAETEKYRVGKSTSINVAQAQRDLLQSQVDEAQAITDYFRSLIALFKAEGILLKHYQISILKH